MKLLKPQKLSSGDTVGIISPSGPVYSKKDLARGLKAIESLGLKPKIGNRALDVHKTYEAGSRFSRLRDFREMMLDDEVRAIFCTNGGYASIQLLPELDYKMFKEFPKPIIGYSDITNLLNVITEKTGLVTFHGPVVEELGVYAKKDKFSLKNLEDILMNGKEGLLPSYTEWKVIKAGRAEGELIGGNLDVLLGLMGTPYEPKFDSKILFIEEVSSSVEDIDTRLWRLRVAKVFKKIEGLIVGKITNLLPIDEDRMYWGDIEKPPTIEEIIREVTQGFDFPVLYNVDIGHDVPSLTLPIGVGASLDCSDEGRVGTISLLESGVLDEVREEELDNKKFEDEK